LSIAPRVLSHIQLLDNNPTSTPKAFWGNTFCHIGIQIGVTSANMERLNETATTDEVDVEKKEESALGGHRISFIPATKPERMGREDGSTFSPMPNRSQSVASNSQRPQSTVLLPPVISTRDRKIREKESKDEVKHVDISEHLMTAQDVAARYKTMINMKRPAESLGLTAEQAKQLLLDHGPHNLTPPLKRHWALKFWDCLSSLFNLLLILAGCLEYILLSIDFKGNFQNVS
jgi:sodium/potassium-transporting ATPase subunit alpha